MTEIAYTVHTFKEGDTFVAYVPELDISSCGASRDEAMRNIRDAVDGFLESSAAQGSLDSILEESGYRRSGEAWESPEYVGLDRQTARVA